MKNSIISALLLLSSSLLFLTNYSVYTETVKVEEVYLLSDRIMINTVTHEDFLEWDLDELKSEIQAQAEEEFLSKGEVKIDILTFSNDSSILPSGSDELDEAGVLSVDFILTWDKPNGKQGRYKVNRTMIVGGRENHFNQG